MVCLDLASAARAWIAEGECRALGFAAAGFVIAAFVAWVPMVRTIVDFDKERDRG